MRSVALYYLPNSAGATEQAGHLVLPFVTTARVHQWARGQAGPSGSSGVQVCSWREVRGWTKCMHAQGGVWVLGMIKGGAADRAGVRQGDEVLSIDNRDVASLSPFQAAGLLQGIGDDAAPSVDLTVRTLLNFRLPRKSASRVLECRCFSPWLIAWLGSAPCVLGFGLQAQASVVTALQCYMDER